MHNGNKCDTMWKIFPLPYGEGKGTNAMKELETILKDHARRYGQMEPTDAVKLIYQNEFGGGHLIRDEESCRNYLYREYAAVEKSSVPLPPEPLGNGMVRVYLSGVREEELEQLAQRFIRSAAIHTGAMESFLEKLEVLRNVTRQGCFAFDSEQLDGYLQAYRAAGYPMVSHSQAYRKAYSPAYRVVLEKLPETEIKE